MFDNPEYSFSCCPTSSELGDDDVSPFSPSCRKLTKKSSKNRRRFSDEQIKSLESLFESETRLEPRKKVQLASELGLQPRQVAIWFQNKRARWKSKQLERDYNILLANYNSLASRFDALKKEKQSLQLQLQKLNNDMKQKSGEEMDDHDKVVKCETSDGKPCSSMEKSEHVLGVLSDDDSNMKAEYFGLEDEQELLNMNMAAEPSHHEPADHSSPEDWGRLNSETDLFNESSGGYQWWDFWS